ncbi:MBL fold metallo-hydrolase [Candidatus Mesenet endosymbiont of Agriotes lineatus]|uniref:MBL fold metallo-hydrolase n=1 Tax=Candidatus Mesenet endosymbiont of Agriotes lineatus TaxID=3077948 RepID=UPI0030CA6716
MKVTILGCGPSVGIPTIGCKCDVCKSALSDSKNKRTRTSALIEHEGTTILIDSSPDFRMQAIANQIDSMDAVIYTHPHADHCAGITELSAIEPKEGQKTLPIYGSINTLTSIISSYPQLFIPNTPSNPWNKCHYLTVNRVDYHREWEIGRCRIVAFPQVHGNIVSTGFIFNDLVAYCTDVKEFPQKSWEILKSKEDLTLILGCIGYQEATAHAHFDLCLNWVEQLSTKQVILTHMSHYIDYYTINSKLKTTPKIKAAYDSFAVEV